MPNMKKGIDSSCVEVRRSTSNVLRPIFLFQTFEYRKWQKEVEELLPSPPARAGSPLNPRGPGGPGSPFLPRGTISETPALPFRPTIYQHLVFYYTVAAALINLHQCFICFCRR